MDGNGRWAKQRMLPRVAGHRKGVEAVRGVVRACLERGVEFLTLFAFSSENWRRPADEVSILMELFLRALEQEVAKLHENGIRFRVIGDTVALRSAHPRADRRRRGAHRRQHAAHAGDRRELRRALGHRAGGAPLFRAAIREAVHDDAGLRPEAIEPFLAMAYAPEPDLFIRTGGEQRISQLPALAARLHRALFHRPALAGFRRGRARRRDRVVPRARAALRPHQRAGAGGRRVSAAELARASGDGSRCC